MATLASKVVAAVVIVVGTACSSDNTPNIAVTFNTAGNSTSSPATTSPSTSPSGTTVLATSPPISSTGGSAPPSTAGTTTTPVATAPAPLGDPSVGLTELGTFNQPVDTSWRAGDGTTYVVEQDGRIVIMNNGGPGPTALDMTNLTSASGEQGLLGLAVSADGGSAYVDYT
ncbi:MAG: hypothetical protein QOE00_1728, partial [Ilumatobacteraceae bacterium]